MKHTPTTSWVEILKPILGSVREKKPLEVTASYAPHIYLSVTLGRMNVAYYKKPLEQFRRVSVEGHALHITGTIVAIAI